MSVKVAIVGVTGITGEELLRVFETYPQVEVAAATARQETRTLGQLYPQFKRFTGLAVTPFDAQKLKDLKTQIVFVALPHGEAMPLVPDLLQKKMKVIDLGADFRLKDREIFEKWYVPHTAWDLVRQAAYGMVEFNFQKIRKAKLVANPGCYVTAATFALKPLLDARLIEKKGLIVDAKSGASGGGRKLIQQKLEWEQSFKPYAVNGHRHQPEIEQNIKANVIFMPHLLPIYRGIIATCYAKLRRGKNLGEVQKVFKELAAKNTFVEYVESAPELRNVIGTNKVQIFVCEDPHHDRLIVISALDNLVKGASGQAIQNMNVMLGWPMEQGLSNLGVLTDNRIP